MASCFFIRSQISFHLALLIFMSSILYSSFAELPKFEHRIKGDGSLSFLVVGDWGREGMYNQSDVAFQMGRIGEKLDIDFVISTGDNFYDNGLTGVNDSAFDKSFTKIYTAKSLQKQWYAVLGNHDYRGNVEAQVHPILRTIDKRWFCMKNYIVNAGVAEFFFVDTTPFVESYFTDAEHVYDWSNVIPQSTYIMSLLKDLDMALKESTAKWKIVVGHHAIRSAGYHGETPELIQHLLPILESNDVDFYMNGHDHCLEQFSSLDSTIQFLTSGGGSKAWRGDSISDIENYPHHHANDGMKFFYDGQGFMSLHITPKHSYIAFYNIFGHILHRWKASKLLHSQI